MFKKFSWGHGVVLGLGSFIIFILYMVIYFGNGMKNAEMVSDNYYEEELNYQEVIDGKKNGDLLPVKPEYIQDKSGISLSFPKEIMPLNKKISFVLYRTEDANLDIKKDMVLDDKNLFSIPGRLLTKGSYILKVKWVKDKKPYQLDYSLQWK